MPCWLRGAGADPKRRALLGAGLQPRGLRRVEDVAVTAAPEQVTTAIADLLPWGKEQQVQTKAGPRIVRKAAPTEGFWSAWRAAKEQLRAAGVSVTQYQGQWQVAWWIPIDPEQLAREQAARETAQALTRATDAEVIVPAPEGLEYRGYQKAGVAFGSACWKTGRGVLIADEMGLGKTIQVIGLINSTPEIQRVLIVCPNTLKGNWSRELRKWLIRPLRIGVQKAGVPWLGDVVDIVIVNYDIVHKYPEAQIPCWDLRVMDEAHYCKNPKARRTKATLSTRAWRKVSLTGTPIENRPVELWPIISDLDPQSWDPKKGFFTFAKKYCDAKNNGFGWDFSGHSKEQELQHKLRSTIMVRRLKADVLTELPPKRRQIIEIEADGNLRAAEVSARDATERLEELRARVELARASDRREDYEAAVAELEEGAGAAFAEMSKLRFELGMAKLPQAIAFIEDALESSKCIVFGHHIDVIKALKDRFPQAAVITGSTPGDQRMAEVDRFQNDPECNVFLGNNAAAEGITLTAGSHVIFVEGDWVPGKLAQKEDRAHRIGQRDSVLVSYLVVDGTIDADMIKANVDKLSVIDRVLDKVTDYKEQAAPVAGGDAPSVRAARVTFESMAKEAAGMSAEACALALEGMQRLAGVCDGAARRDMAGFSGVDARIGHSLAQQARLSPKQGLLAAKLCRKYKRQLGEEFLARLAACGGKV